MKELRISQCRQAISGLKSLRPNNIKSSWKKHKQSHSRYITDSHLQTKIKMVSSAFMRLDEQIDQSINEYNTQIKSLETQALKDSEQWYLIKKLPEITDHESFIHRPIQILEKHHSVLDKRMKLYNDWHYPGLCIQPRHGWIENMASCDPLYIVDYKVAFTEPSKEVFNKQFQKRVRQYQQDVWHPKCDRLFHRLPQEQFGFILSFQWLDYLPIQGITKVLAEVKDLLRPGGTFLFSYNNCEYPASCKLFENGTHPYTTQTMVQEAVSQHDLVINYVYSDTGFDWMEVKKSGELQSVKHGQAVGKIWKTEVEQPKPKDRWNKKEIEAIQQEAIDIGIDGPKEIKSAYSIPTLVKKIEIYKVQQAKLKAKANKQDQDK